jgi:CBS domain-containing protein
MSTNSVPANKQVNGSAPVVHQHVPPGSGDWVAQSGASPGGTFPVGEVARVSNQFENSRTGNPVLDPKAVGAVTDDPGDHGGLSMGIVQVSANTGSLQEYLSWLSSHHPDLRKALGGPPYDKQFQASWKKLAQTQTEAFGNSQLEQFKDSAYDPAVKLCLQKTGIDINKAPLPLQQAFWSSVVQHHKVGATAAIQAGLDAQRPDKTFRADYSVNGKPIDLGRLLYTLYAERGLTTSKGTLANFHSSSLGIQRGVAHRFGQERLTIVKEYLGHSLDTGKVSDLMSSKPVTARSNQTVGDFLKATSRDPARMHNGYPVIDSTGKCVGLVTRRRLLAADPSTPISKVLPSKKLVSISSDLSAKDAFNLMTSKEVSQMVVMDPNTGKPKGVLATIDLLGMRSLSQPTAQKAGRPANPQPGDRWTEDGVEVRRAGLVNPRLGG